VLDLSGSGQRQVLDFCDNIVNLELVWFEVLTAVLI
jgi:hypothetical protein